MPPREGLLLGFDYGSKRIGVAVGERITGMARPLETVAVRQHRPDWDTITRLIETWNPSALVVGQPLTLEDEEQEMTAAAARFGRQLHGRYRLPVHTMDERLTTMEAKSILRERGDSIREADPVAAKLILESWMFNHQE